MAVPPLAAPVTAVNDHCGTGGGGLGIGGLGGCAGTGGLGDGLGLGLGFLLARERMPAAVGAAQLMISRVAHNTARDISLDCRTNRRVSVA